MRTPQISGDPRGHGEHPQTLVTGVQPKIERTNGKGVFRRRKSRRCNYWGPVFGGVPPISGVPSTFGGSPA